MTEEHAEKEAFSERDILTLLGQLVELWRTKQEAGTPPPRSQQAPTQLPEPPQYGGFRDAKALAEYASAQHRHEQERERRQREREDLDRRYEEAREKVAEVLPPGTHVSYDHVGEHYVIAREANGKVVVERLYG